MISAPEEINQDSTSSGVRSPQLSIVIPARNEEEYLPRCLDAIEASLAMAKLTAEVVVVLNRCTDRTEEIACERGCVIVRSEAKNLASIRNTGVRSSSAPWVVTVDADSQVSKNMFLEISRVLSSQQSVGGGVLILAERYSLGIILTACFLLPYVLFERLAGGLFFFTREAFEAIDGFDESFHSVEDIDFARRLKRYGSSIGKKFTMLFRAHIVTSTRKFDRLGDWYFIKRPLLLWKLLHNRDPEESRKFWYDFER